jgi:hypothetical protein
LIVHVEIAIVGELVGTRFRVFHIELLPSAAEGSPGFGFRGFIFGNGRGRTDAEEGDEKSEGEGT